MSLKVQEVQENVHPAVAVRMAMTRLEASEEWVAIHGKKRTFEEGRTAQKPGEVFAIVKQRPSTAHIFGGPNGWLEKKVVELTVLSVRSYPLGGATEWDFVKSYNLILSLLVFGFDGMIVNDPDGTKIGEVSEVAYLDDVKYSTPGAFVTVHHGVKMRVTYR